MKFNPFNDSSPLHDFRWFVVVLIAVSAFLVYHDAMGGRIFSSSRQQQWNAGGPGYHK